MIKKVEVEPLKDMTLEEYQKYIKETNRVDALIKRLRAEESREEKQERMKSEKYEANI